MLLTQGELCVCDFMAVLEITQSKASRHLATLRHAGLVVDRKEGAWSYYSIYPVDGELERAQLEALRASLTEHASAARVLRKLHEWLDLKDREAKCVEDCACRTVTKSRQAAPFLTPLEGGTR